MNRFYLFLLPLAGLLLTPDLSLCQPDKNVEVTQVMNIDILFDFGKYELNDANKEKLEILYDHAASLNLYYVEITAHTDSIGNIRNNYKLSQKRGGAVKDFLLELGMPDKQVKMQVYGENVPVADNKSEEGRQRNRRSEVILYEIMPPPAATPEPQPEPANAEPELPILKEEPTPEPEVEPLLFFDEPAPDEIQTPKGVVEEPPVVENVEEPIVEEVAEPIAEEPLIIVEEILLEDNFVEEDAVAEPPVVEEIQPEEPPVVENPAQELPPIEQKLNAESIGESFALENLYFVGDQEVLTDGSKTELEKLHRFMLLNPNIRIEIGGHINFQGKLDPYSLDYRLAEFRARMIYDYLIQKGVEHWRLAYKGYGNSFMRFPEPRTEAEAEQNRRVEIKITGFGKPN